MKKLLAVIFLTFAASMGYCIESVWKSSTTSSGIPVGSLCGSGKRGELFNIIVSSPGGDLANLSVWNSTWTPAAAYLKVGPIDTSRIPGNYEYRVIFSSGLVVTSTGAATTTILYECF